jgi:hypothetical protein
MRPIDYSVKWVHLEEFEIDEISKYTDEGQNEHEMWVDAPPCICRLYMRCIYNCWIRGRLIPTVLKLSTSRILLCRSVGAIDFVSMEFRQTV